jgi:hypothetical protein
VDSVFACIGNRVLLIAASTSFYFIRPKIINAGHFYFNASSYNACIGPV